MHNAREMVYDIASTVVGVILGGTALILLNDGLSYVPQIESWISPVVRISAATATYRDKQKSCFTINIVKLAMAVPIKYEFFVETHLSAKLAASVYLADANWNRLGNSDLVTHPVGQTWARTYCFETPATVADFQPMRVTGYALHNRHPIYDTRTNVTPFVIPALPGS